MKQVIKVHHKAPYKGSEDLDKNTQFAAVASVEKCEYVLQYGSDPRGDADKIDRKKGRDKNFKGFPLRYGRHWALSKPYS